MHDILNYILALDKVLVNVNSATTQTAHFQKSESKSQNVTQDLKIAIFFSKIS